MSGRISLTYDDYGKRERKQLMAILALVAGVIGIIVGIVLPGYFYKKSTKDLQTSTQATLKQVEMVISGLEHAGLITPVRNDKGETTGYVVHLAAHGLTSTSTWKADLSVTRSPTSSEEED